MKKQIARSAGRRVLAAVTTCALLGACGGANSPGGPQDAPVHEEPPLATGSLRGSVRLAGTLVPERPVIENTTDPEVCGRLQQTNDLLVDAGTRGIANVIVSLRGVPSDEVPARQPSRLVLDNLDCQFVPRAAVLEVGSSIEAVSHDDVLHTVHLYGALERNVALPDPSASLTVTVEKPGMIAVLCDVHGWMKAYVRVDSHPFHAVTGLDGTFAIEDLPTGSYELDVWHERLGSQSLAVRVGRDAADELRIVYTLGEH